MTTLRIMRSTQIGANKGIAFDPSSVLASVGLLSAIKGKSPMFTVFAELQSGQSKLGKNRVAVLNSIEELNKLLSIVHRLEMALSIVDRGRAAAVCRGIAASAPARKVIALFDPRRSDERMSALLDRFKYTIDMDISLIQELKAMLAEAEERILTEIASKERYLRLADIEAENIKAQESVLAGMGLSVLYKLFKAS